MDWQPIETAPKDGTVVLLYYPKRQGWESPVVISGLWRPYEKWRCWDTSYRQFGGVHCLVEGDENPTHWMPLPKPPEVK